METTFFLPLALRHFVDFEPPLSAAAAKLTTGLLGAGAASVFAGAGLFAGESDEPSLPMVPSRGVARVLRFAFFVGLSKPSSPSLIDPAAGVRPRKFIGTFGLSLSSLSSQVFHVGVFPLGRRTREARTCAWVRARACN